MPDIFLSYSREDQATARRVAEGFERAGFSVWWDQTLSAGEAYDEVTEKALLEARAVVVLWSKNSVASRWVRAEATQAERHKTLVPAMIEPCTRPIMFELTHTADLANWTGDANDKNWQAYLASVRRFVDRNATGAPGTAPAPALLPVPGQSRGNKYGMIAIGAAVLLTAGAGMWMLAHVHEPNAGAQVAEHAPDGTPVATVPEASVAVLPFRNFSADPSQDYFADGITEEILNSLAGLHDLKVTGRTSSFAFKGKDVDLRTIGETLGVRNILEGSVRKDGKQLRITVQLNNAQTGYHLWSKTYDRPLDGIFAIQEDIARSVAQAMQISLGVGDLGRQKGMTRNVEAYDAYLAAAALDPVSPLVLRSALNQFERAVALDPSFVSPWLRLVNAYAFASAFVLEGNTREGWAAKADAALQQASRIAPESPEVLMAFADRSNAAWHWADAAQKFERARIAALEQGRAVPFEVSLFKLTVGRARDALAPLEAATRSDPLNVFLSLLLAEAYADTGNLSGAIAEHDRGIRLNGFQMALRGSAVATALATKDRALINKRMAQAMEVETNRPGFFATMNSLLDRKAEAEAQLRRFSTEIQDASQLSVNAVWITYFGDPDAALDIYRSHLQIFRSARRNGMLFDLWRPVMSDVRKLPGFKDLMRDMGLVDYWKEYGWADVCKPVATDDFECT